MASARNVFPSAADLRRAFDVPAPMTVGLEEEVMLLHPVTLDLLPRAGDVLARCDGDRSVKGELPASQLELVTCPATRVGEVAAALWAARTRLARAAEGIGMLAGAGTHPFTAPEGVLTAGDIMWGSRALAELDRRFQVHTLDAWQDGRTSLRSWPRLAVPLVPAVGFEAGDLMSAVAEGSDA